MKRINFIILLISCIYTLSCTKQDEDVSISTMTTNSLVVNNIPKVWYNVITVKDFTTMYASQSRSLLDQLNLEYPGLEKVKAAYAKSDWETACRELLRYYSLSSYVMPISKLPRKGNGTTISGENALNGKFSAQGTTSIIPHLPDGHYNWLYTGPNNDPEYCNFINRHGMATDLMNAYFSTGNVNYSKAFDLFLKDWIVSSWPCPTHRISSNAPGMWRGLESGIRAGLWFDFFYKFYNVPEFSDATKLMMLYSLTNHAYYLRNFYSADNNWLLGEQTGLAGIATYWPEYKESPSWLSFSMNMMKNSLNAQIYPEGAQHELTSSYHYGCISAYESFVNIVKHTNNVNTNISDFNSTIRKMYSYLCMILRPNGTAPANNDAESKDYKNILLSASAKYNMPEWKYIVTNGTQGTRPSTGPSCFFNRAGQLISRSGWDAKAQYSFFDIGPWGYNHQHNDKLNLCIFAYGRDLLVDGGRFVYSGNLAASFRAYATGSESHNVVLVDGNGQGAYDKTTTSAISSNTYEINNIFDFACGSFKQFNKVSDFTQNRSVLYVKNKFWVVVDLFLTKSKHNIQTLWHWHPDCNNNISVDNNRGIVKTTNVSGNLAIIPVDTGWKLRNIKGQVNPRQGWFSRRYNQYEENVCSDYSCDVQSGSTVKAWILYPSASISPSVLVSKISQNINAVTFKVTSGKQSWIVTVPFYDKKYASVK